MNDREHCQNRSCESLAINPKGRVDRGRLSGDGARNGSPATGRLGNVIVLRRHRSGLRVGFPVAEGPNVYAIDGALSLIEAIQHNIPNKPAVCEAVEYSTFFDRTFARSSHGD